MYNMYEITAYDADVTRQSEPERLAYGGRHIIASQVTSLQDINLEELLRGLPPARYVVVATDKDGQGPAGVWLVTTSTPAPPSIVTPGI